MSNEWHSPTPPLVPGELARAEDVNAKASAIDAAFDRFPAPHATLKGFAEAIAIGEPTAPGHATSRNFVETSMTSQVTQAASSATAASGSATAASGSASSAATQASNASSSANNAAASATTATTQATNASNSANAALTSKNAAATSATNAATSESNALTSKNAAATSATNAATSESNALTSKNAAATSATNAASSASAAATSATNSSNSATASANSATAASGSATSASNSASTATTQAGNASSSASAAATSETNASNSASTATTQATNASNSATTSMNWAQFTTDSPVPGGGGGFSAKHWAEKAAETITNATTVGTTNDTTTNATHYLGFLAAASGNNPVKVSSTKLTFNPSTGVLGATSFAGPLSGNATSATTAAALTTARTISLSGDVTGSVSFNGSANVDIVAAVADNSHAHTIANVTSLQAALDAKAALDSPTFTGVPAAPTAAVNTSTTQLATTAFVVAQIADDAPTKAGGGASGSWGISVTGSSASCTGNAATATSATNVGITNDTATDAAHYLAFVAANAGNNPLKVTSTKLTFNPLTGVLGATSFSGPLSGNATTASTLATARTISLSGDVTGSVSFNGSAAVDIAATVADNSHAHTIANVTGLQTALDAKAPLASPALTGTPSAPTAALNTNTTQLATTAFTLAQIADDAPTKTGGGASGTWGISVTGNAATVTTNANLTGVVTSVGNATSIADAALSIAKTSGLQAALDAKAALASPTFTGTPAAPTAALGTNTTQLASTGFVIAQIAGDSVLKSGSTSTGAQILSGGGRITPSATPQVDEIGYLGTPQNIQAAAYTFVLADRGKDIFHDSTAATYTIPANATVAFPIGTIITITNNTGAGAITLAITTDILRRGDGTAGTGSRTIPADAVAAIKKTKATEWMITGVFT